MGTRSSLHTLPHAIAFHLSRRPRLYRSSGLALFILAFLAFLLLLPPPGFPIGESIVVEEGISFGETAQMLEDRHVVTSALALRVLARIGGADERIQAGRYVLERPQGLTTVLHRLAHGISGIPAVRVTFPEGTTVREMAAILKASLPMFDTEQFLSLAEAKEGYLFPDTYYLSGEASPEEVIALLEGTYNEKIETFAGAFSASKRSRTDVMIMASLVEREAGTLEDRKMIAGILWARLDQGRALQVDAVFGYIRGVATYHPSLDDLAIDSPYNTYLYPGLPPGPIANPGLDSIEAALLPTESEYLYYLTGTDGVMRYARTFGEHKENRARYLD